MIVALSSLSASGQEGEADSICKILKYSAREGRYQEAIKLIEGGAYCTCAKTTKNSTSSSLKFGQGLFFDLLVKGLFGAGSSTSTLYWRVLSRKYSPGRDSMLIALTEHDKRFNGYGGHRYITAYIRNNQENFNAALLDRMFDRADKENRNDAFEEALEHRYDKLIDVYIKNVEWKKNGVYTMQRLVCADTLELVEKLYKSNKLSVNYRTGSHRLTVLHMVLNNPNRVGRRKLDDSLKLEFLQILKRQNFNFNLRDHEGKSTFDICIQRKQHKMFDFMVLNQPSLLLEKNKDRQTALHLAVAANNSIMVEKLLQLGVDPNLKDRFRKKAADYANDSQPRILKLLGQPYDTSLLYIRILNDYAQASSMSTQGKDSVAEILEMKRHQGFRLTDKWENVEYHVLKDALDSRNFYFANKILSHKGGLLDSAELFLLKESYFKALKKENYEGVEAIIGYCEPCRRNCVNWILGAEKETTSWIIEREKDKLSRLKEIYKKNILNIVKVGDSKQAFHTGENVQIGEMYDEIKPFGEQTWTLAKRNAKWGILDLGLNEVVPFEYDSLKNVVASGYPSQSYVFTGVKDSHHNVIKLGTYPYPYYKNLEMFDLPNGQSVGDIRFNGYQITIKTKKENSIGLSVIYRRGNLTAIYPPLYDDITVLKGKIFAVKKNDKWSLQLVKEYKDLKFKWAGYRINEEGRVQVRKKKRWKDLFYY